MHCLAHLKNPAANREATVAICSSDLLDRKTGRCFQPQQDEPQRPIIRELLQPGIIQKLIPRGQDQGGQTPNRTNNACPEGTALDNNGRCQKVQ